MENRITQIMTRFYNQREELAELSQKALFLFDRESIMIYHASQINIKKLSKNVDESENWV